VTDCALLSRRYHPGGTPAHRTNALLNEISDSHPISVPIVASDNLEFDSNPAATCMRRPVTYSITLEPIEFTKTICEDSSIFPMRVTGAR